MICWSGANGAAHRRTLERRCGGFIAYHWGSNTAGRTVVAAILSAAESDDFMVVDEGADLEDTIIEATSIDLPK
jgi:hypothetical protein